ncbi:MAG: AMP-binding protein [Gammaproteobacteria bacterium]
MTSNSRKTPQEMLLHWEQTASDQIWLHQPANRQWRQFSWREVGDEARRITAALQGLGIKPGDRVGIFSKNCAEWIISDLAIMLGGFISVPIYNSANADTLGYVLNHAECKAVFVGKLDKAEGLEKAIPEGCVSIAYPYETLPATLQWQELLKSNEPVTDVVIPDMDDVMTILYTSGSTGNPKGAVHTYASYEFVGSQIGKVWNGGPQEKVLSYLPMAHCTDRAYVEAASLYRGTQVAFTESLATFFEDLRTVRPTIFGSVPRLWKRFQLGVFESTPPEKLERLIKLPIVGSMVKKKIAKGLGMDRSTWNGSGAAPIAPSLLEWWSRIGIPVCEGWGMTETLAYGTQSYPGLPIRIGSIGKALPGVELKLTDEGELLIKSPSLMREYYKEPEKTAEEFTADGFFRTGDRAEIDSDGYVKITGRAKEIFKTAKGKYVAPVPIESLLAQNDMVEQVCLVGSGLTQPVALVQLAPELKLDAKEVASSLEATREQVNSSLESHARISRVVVIKDAWTPENGMLTPTQKIKRHVVEKKFAPITSAETGPGVEFE